MNRLPAAARAKKRQGIILGWCLTPTLSSQAFIRFGKDDSAQVIAGLRQISAELDAAWYLLNMREGYKAVLGGMYAIAPKRISASSEALAQQRFIFGQTPG